MVVSEFDQFIVLLGTEELKFIPLTAWPEHSVWLLTGVNTGIGFTVTLYVVLPKQPFWSVTFKV
jgi:hypothetical protein